jgi:drug/metabolite transporter (DMT)-like permease
MPDAFKEISWREYFQSLFPIAVLYGYCLGAGNEAFLYSSVAFVQMVKPINVMFTTLAAFALGLEIVTFSHVFIVGIVVLGVFMAALGDVEFSIVGCALQLSASFGEGLRLALLQKVMTKEAKLDPVTTIYRFAPVAGMALCVTACFVETPIDWSQLKSPSMLALNLLAAVVLNILIVIVIQKASAVVFTLSGILKDILTISISVGVFTTPMTSTQVFGYATSVGGIGMYKVYKDNIQIFLRHGFLKGVYLSAASRESGLVPQDLTKGSSK